MTIFRDKYGIKRRWTKWLNGIISGVISGLIASAIVILLFSEFFIPTNVSIEEPKNNCQVTDKGFELKCKVRLMSPNKRLRVMFYYPKDDSISVGPEIPAPNNMGYSFWAYVNQDRKVNVYPGNIPQKITILVVVLDKTSNNFLEEKYKEAKKREKNKEKANWEYDVNLHGPLKSVAELKIIVKVPAPKDDKE